MHIFLNTKTITSMQYFIHNKDSKQGMERLHWSQITLAGLYTVTHTVTALNETHPTCCDTVTHISDQLLFHSSWLILNHCLCDLRVSSWKYITMKSAYYSNDMQDCRKHATFWRNNEKCKFSVEGRPNLFLKKFKYLRFKHLVHPKKWHIFFSAQQKKETHTGWCKILSSPPN